jgi:hypothetical protein
MTPDDHQNGLPEADLRPERRMSRAWLILVLAILMAAWLGYRAWLLRGVVITVHLERGHGIQPGDDVRYRGIVVGRVRSVALGENVDGVTVKAALLPPAAHLARGGARIWVVRPKLDVTGVAGLETVVGPRYLAMLPGDGPPRRHFLGLSEPPIIESIEPGDLEIVLQATDRSGMRPGAPILYREVTVGTILSVGLASDGGSVEARVHIPKAYAQLIRPETRFWDVGGIDASVGIGGLAVEVDSIESLLAGGVALATPPDAGEVVHTGHRFQLEDGPEKEWLAWAPPVVIGSSFLPRGAVMPTPLRALVGWKEGRWIRSDRSRRGWVLQTERGLLGPADLLHIQEDEDRATIVLEVAGRTIPLTQEPVWTDGRLARLGVQVAPMSRSTVPRRHAAEPEDCLVVADQAATPLPLAAARLTPEEGVWIVDQAVSVDTGWHGAAVVARADGRVVGLMLVGEDQAARVALLPEE